MTKTGPRHSETDVEAGNADLELTLIVKADCGLCEQARSTVHAVAREFNLSVQEKTLENDRELSQRFAEEVPVVLIDGVPRDFWIIDPARLRRLVTQRLADRRLESGQDQCV